MKRINILAFLLGIVFSIILWSIVAKIFNSQIIFPSVYNILSSLYNIIVDKNFYSNFLASIIRVFITFSIAIILGIALGVLSGLVSFFNYFFMPIVSFIRTIPLLPLILIAVVWFNSSLGPIFVSLLMIFPIIYDAILYGILNVDKKLIEMSVNYNVSIKNKILHLYIPSIIPYFFTSVSQSMGVTWKSVLAAEILALPVLGIGTKLYETHLYLDTGSLFAYCLVAVIINAIFEILIRARKKYGR